MATCIPYSLEVFSVEEQLPQALQDVWVVWEPADGEPPIWINAYINLDGLWCCIERGDPFQRQDEITYWAYPLVVPKQFRKEQLCAA